jgi:hypothetical protein
LEGSNQSKSNVSCSPKIDLINLHDSTLNI